MFFHINKINILLLLSDVVVCICIVVAGTVVVGCCVVVVVVVVVGCCVVEVTVVLGTIDGVVVTASVVAGCGTVLYSDKRWMDLKHV